MIKFLGCDAPMDDLANARQSPLVQPADMLTTVLTSKRESKALLSQLTNQAMIAFWQ